MHATEHGRQQGRLAEPVQSSIHSVERWLCQSAAAVIVCFRFMAGEVTPCFRLRDKFPRLRLTVAGTGQLLAEQQDRARRHGVVDLISWRAW